MGKFIMTLILVFLYSCQKQDALDFNQAIVIGETLTLTAEEPNQLWQKNVSQLLLYQILPDRSKIVYTEGLDYTIQGNKIRRTATSRIADFANHKVVYGTDGKFKWDGRPEPYRNPESNLSYQIYADYSYKSSYSQIINPYDRLSYVVRHKLQTAQPIKILCAGTSITCAIDTFEEYYYKSNAQSYPNLVAQAITELYGSQCIMNFLSENGGAINQLYDLECIIREKPDIVFLEFGMNDHLGINPDINSFSITIENAIIDLKARNIDVVLIGFFQQIESWELEYPQNTISFNNLFKELSIKYDIYFADIYTAFEKLDKAKLYKDYMGDYIHHPTSFGHQLYYLEIMPYFIKTSTTQSELLQYIY